MLEKNNLKISEGSEFSFSIKEEEEASGRLELAGEIAAGKKCPRLAVQLKNNQELPSSFKIPCYIKKEGFAGCWQKASEKMKNLVPITLIDEQQKKQVYYLNVSSLIKRLGLTKNEILKETPEELLTKIAIQATAKAQRENTIAKIQGAVSQHFGLKQDEARLIALKADPFQKDKPSIEGMENDENLLRPVNEAQAAGMYVGKIEGQVVLGMVGKEIGSGSFGKVSFFSCTHLSEENTQVQKTASNAEYIYKAHQKAFSLDSMYLSSQLHDAKNIGGAKLVPCSSDDGRLVAALQKYEGKDLFTLTMENQLPDIKCLWIGMTASLEQMLTAGLLDIDFKPENFTWNEDEKIVKRIDLDSVFPINTSLKNSSPAHTPSYTPHEFIKWKGILRDLIRQVESSGSPLNGKLLNKLRTLNPNLPDDASKEDCKQVIEDEWRQALFHVARYQIAASYIAVSSRMMPYINDHKNNYPVLTHIPPLRSHKKNYVQKPISQSQNSSNHPKEVLEWLGLLEGAESPFARMRNLTTYVF
jgi:hypothetical protein